MSRWLLMLGLLLPPAALRAQDSTAQAPDTLVAPELSPPADSVPRAAARDTVRRPPLSPMGALLRSFLIPGWGQARLGRRLTGGVFVAWEGVTLAMSVKTTNELTYLRRTNSARHDSKRKEQQDWLVLLAFNHLFSGLEAYVSAHLWDFPGDLQLQALPDGFGAAVSLPVRLP